MSEATSSITYQVGDATRPERPRSMAERPAIITHIVNDVGAWGKGFVMALSRRWPAPESAYREWAEDELSGLRPGMVQFLEVEPLTSDESGLFTGGLEVANMVAQRGLRSADNPTPLDTAALRRCLQRVQMRARFLGASVHMPRIGTGLSGGDWPEIEPIIEAELIERSIPVTVYDLPAGDGQP
jgi:O-acetyl-ADP-ribose deacetylase (regulator of RNase III)